MSGSWWSSIWPWGRNGDNRKVGLQTTRNERRDAGIDFDQAMAVSAYWACVRLLSEVVASMPLKCYRIDQEEFTRTQIFDYPLYELLANRPNRYQSPVEFWESVMLNITNYGNSYNLLTRSNGEIVSVFPLQSAQMTVRLLDDGSTQYEYTRADNQKVVYSESQIWHIKLFGNGVVGLSPLSYAANALDTARSLESRTNSLASNGGKTNGILTVDEVLKQDQRDAIKENFDGLVNGNDAQLFVLEADMKYQQTSLSPTDMQLIQNRKFQIEDICRFMGVPSVLVNDTSATTTWGSGIEQIATGFYKLNLRPYLERIESSLKRWLIPPEDWGTIEIEFDFDTLLRADRETRIKSNGTAINSGQMTPNEARRDEGKAPKDGGDEIYLNGSLRPASSIDDEGNSDGT